MDFTHSLWSVIVLMSRLVALTEKLLLPNECGVGQSQDGVDTDTFTRSHGVQFATTHFGANKFTIHQKILSRSYEVSVLEVWFGNFVGYVKQRTQQQAVVQQRSVGLGMMAEIAPQISQRFVGFISGLRAHVAHFFKHFLSSIIRMNGIPRARLHTVTALAWLTHCTQRWPPPATMVPCQSDQNRFSMWLSWSEIIKELPGIFPYPWSHLSDTVKSS